MIALLVVAAAAVGALALVAASASRTLAFTLGVASSGVWVQLQPGQEVCQQPVLVEAAFDLVELHLATGAGPAPRLAVTIRPAAGGAAIAHGTLPPGSADGSRPVVQVGRVPARGTIAICVRNTGARAVGLYGAPDLAVRTSTALLDGRRTDSDLDLVLRTTRARSTLALLPEMLARAALFRGGWSGPWVYWALLVAVVLVVPALIMRALTAVARDDRSA